MWEHTISFLRSMLDFCGIIITLFPPKQRAQTYFRLEERSQCQQNEIMVLGRDGFSFSENVSVSHCVYIYVCVLRLCVCVCMCVYVCVSNCTSIAIWPNNVEELIIYCNTLQNGKRKLDTFTVLHQTILSKCVHGH